MSLETKRLAFGDFELDVEERLLSKNGQQISLTPKAFQLLLTLLQNHGHVVAKSELMDTVWADSFVEEGNLTFTVSVLRKALDDDGKHPHYIETVSRRGYRFIADVHASEPETPSFPLSSGVHLPENGHLPSDTSSADSREQPLRSEPRYVLWASVGLIAVLLLAGLAYLPSNSAGSPEGPDKVKIPFQNGRTIKLSNGKALKTAVSPDGKQVIYVLESKEGQSLWLRRTAIESGVQVIPPANVEYLGVNFSRDGDTIYYLISGPRKYDGTLYSIPVLGGPTRKLIEHVGGPVGLSHDGTKLAYIVCHSESEGVMRLMVASTDGTGERQVYSETDPIGLWDGMPPAWSPDDGRIAVLRGDTREVMGKLIAVSLSNSTVSDLTENEWRLLSGAEWTTDGLFISGPNKSDDNDEIWLLDPARHTTQKLTSDPNHFGGISLDRDSRTLGTIQYVTLTQLWSVPLADPQNVKQITSGSSNYFDVRFTPQGKLLFAARPKGLGEIWQMNYDDTDHRELTKDAGSNYKPVASPDGRYIYFQSNRGKTFSIYRSLADGSDVRKLTDGEDEEDGAACSPDGKTIVFHNYLQGSWPLKKVSSEGGTPVVLNDRWNQSPAISPDGKLVAVWHADMFADDWKLALIPLTTGGAPIKSFSVQWPDGPIRWTSDGAGLLYRVTVDGVSNIWRQNLSGGKPFPVTKFANDFIFSFDVSPDGKTLVCERGTEAQDVILISDD